MKRAGLALAALLLFGCSESKPKSQPKRTDQGAKPAAASTCDERIAVLEKVLPKYAQAYAFRPVIPAAITLPKAEAGVTVQRDSISGPTVSLSKTGMLLDMGPLSDLKLLTEGVKRKQEQGEKSGYEGKYVLYLVVDTSISAERISEVANAARSQAIKPLEVRRVVSTDVPKPKALISTASFESLVSELEGKEPATRGKRISEELSKAAGSGCPELNQALSKLRGKNKERAEQMAVTVPQALRDCGCAGVDIDMYAPLFELSMRPDPSYAWVVLSEK